MAWLLGLSYLWSFLQLTEIQCARAQMAEREKQCNEMGGGCQPRFVFIRALCTKIEYIISKTTSGEGLESETSIFL